jgi:hypothetical protein
MSETPPSPAPQPARTRLAALRAALPHVVTGLATLAMGLALQSFIFQPAAPAQPQAVATVAIATPLPLPTLLPTPLPQPTSPIPVSGITRQELLDLRAEDDRIWSAIYLSRAISQIADAESALRANDLDRTGQMIVATDDSLTLAYARTPNAMRDPIAQLRRDAGAIREDLYLRPEGMDQRLARFRQSLLALIAERR